MNVVLVLPPFDVAARLGSVSLTKNNRGILPSLGVGYLAGSLETQGHSVVLIDAQVMRWGVPETVAGVLNAAPDVIGISCLSIYAHTTYALAEEIKAKAPDVPVVLGGAHATCFFDTILRDCPSVDLVVRGEAELAFTELIRRLEKGKPYDDVPALVYRSRAGDVVINPPATPTANLDELPHPARHIFNLDLYRPLPHQCRQEPATTVITSRGCPWARCRFCYQSGSYGSTYRRRSPENVVDEVRYLVRELGFRGIIFWDDVFCIQPSWIERLCDLLDREKLDFLWTAQARVNSVTQDMLMRMARSGCYNIYFGFESGNQELLDMIDKGITLDQARQAVKWAKRAGMEIRGSFILGLPTETPEMAERTIRFARELNVDWMMFFPFRIPPGTPIEELAMTRGIVLPETAVHYPAYLPDTYSAPEQLARMVKSAYLKYYVRPRYIARALWRARHPVVIKNYFAAFFYWLDVMRDKKRSARIASSGPSTA
jgi:anaerobic magnesium-protoporphyrin IX monomethyl ester cyclase